MALDYKRIILTSLVGLALSTPATAKDAAGVEVRGVKQSSTDIFDVLSQLLEAESAYKSANYSAALSAYRYVYLHDPSQERAALGYANSALALGRIDTAQKLFRQLSSEDARTGEILCAVIKQETEFPEAALRVRLKITPDDGRLWNLLGRVLDQDGNFPEARKAYVMGGLTQQRAGVTENNLGLSYLTEGKPKKALEHFQRAVAQAPMDLKFDNNRRLALLLEKQYAPALRQLDSERASQILADAGLIAMGQNDPRLAQYLFTKANNLSPVYNAQLESYLTQLSG